MAASSDGLREYLAPDETVIAGEPGTLFDDSYRAVGAIAVTDRRLLFVSEEDEFVDVAHDAIYSIRSRPRREFTLRGIGPVLVAVLGAGLAVAAVGGVLVLDPNLPTLVLTLATVGGVATAERVRRHGAGTEWDTLDASIEAVLDALEDVEVLRGPLGEVRDGGDADLLVIAVASVALTALIGLIAATESLLVVPLSLVAVGGVGVAAYGYRIQRERDALQGERPPDREVSVHLVDGRVVRLQVDPGGRFDRDLSAVVRGSPSATVAATAEPTRP